MHIDRSKHIHAIQDCLSIRLDISAVACSKVSLNIALDESSG